MRTSAGLSVSGHAKLALAMDVARELFWLRSCSLWYQEVNGVMMLPVEARSQWPEGCAEIQRIPPSIDALPPTSVQPPLS